MNEVDITVVCDPGEKDSVASILRGKGFEASTFRDVPHYISVRTLPEYLRVIQAIPGVRYAEIDRESLLG